MILLTGFSIIEISYAYKSEPPNMTHAHITNESQFVWGDIPQEIKNHLISDMSQKLDSDGYSKEEDIIRGSGEEDTEYDASCLAEVKETLSTLFPGVIDDFVFESLWKNYGARPFCYHFWDPDNPEDGDYNDGWEYYGSSYVKANGLWNEKIIPLYIGYNQNSFIGVDQDEAYYWLGRVVHLLEDATAVPHVHSDTHIDGLPEGYPGDSSLENYAGNIFADYHGSDYSNEYYDYNSLPNTETINWDEIIPSGLTADEENLFKLFWYTAQKTQFFASDDVDGNDIYTYINGEEHYLPNLWEGEVGLSQIVSDKNDLADDDVSNEGEDLEKISDAVIPHAMKAVAGLYKLFWSTVRSEMMMSLPDGKTEAKGSVKEGTWMNWLNITESDINKVEIKLTWGTDDNLNMEITGSGGPYLNTSSKTKEKTLILDKPNKENYIINIEGDNSDYVSFTVIAKVITNSYPPTPVNPPPGPSGVNFSSASLKYISTCDPSNGLTFVMSGKDKEAGETLIDISNATNQSMDAFLTGLVIPTSTQWITMDAVPGDGPLGLTGDTSRIDSNFRNTTVAQIMLDADYKLKYDQFGTPADNTEREMIEDWISDVKSSPYWPEMQAQNFNSFPRGKRRTWIYPSVAEANGSDCDIYLTNLTLNVSYVWDYIDLDLSPYNFRQEVKDDLYERLENWKNRYIANHTQKVTNTTIYLVNYDEKYEELRRVAASLSLAQWYKDIYRYDSNAPFVDIIDSNNITGLNLNVSFDEDYWNSKSWEFIYSQTDVPSFIDGDLWTWNWYGGVVLSSTVPDIEEEIDNETEDVVENATIKYYETKDGYNYFGGQLRIPVPDLTPIYLDVSPATPYSGENVNISVIVENIGNIDANDFNIYSYEYYTSSINNYTTKYKISEIIGSVTNNNFTLFNFSWSTNKTGKHNITIEVDYKNNISESNELNNQINISINVISPYPTAEIYSPTNGKVYYSDNGSITFIGIGTDSEDNIISGSNINWTSDIDGYLGNGTILITNLSEGQHIINFTVKDNKGFNASDSVIISVLPSLQPIAEIFSPSENELFSQGQTVYLSGRAIDPEDGLLQNSSLVWNSSVDGILGYGENVNITDLSVAIHSIDLIATDSSGLIDRKQINISYDAGYPNITINNPSNNDEFYYNSNITFNGTSSDPQQGILSSLIQWYSDINGFIGTGSIIYSILNSGWHTITALIVDEYGNTNSTIISVFVNEPLAPSISIITPRNNQQFTDGLNIQFNSDINDLDGSVPNSNINWTSDIDGYLGYGQSLTINTTSMTIGTHTINLNVIDNDNLVNNATINITINSAFPTAVINTPINGQAFRLGQDIIFNTTYNDLEDGQSLTLDWRSSVDGYLGNEPSFNESGLTSGTHTIILNITDSHANNITKSVNIVVVDPGETVLGILSDGSGMKNLTYPIGNVNKTVYVKIPKNATVTYAGLKLRGYAL